jgi:hypothetical protein
LIIFTLTNTITQQVYVGMTKDCANERHKQYIAALPFGIKAPLYDDMRQHGVEAFELNECGFAYDMDEARDLMSEAITGLEAISLQNMKTSASSVQITTKPKISTRAKTKSPPLKKPKDTKTKPKIATGRTGSTVKEKNIREAIEREKADRKEQRYRQIAAESDEMKAIMAKLDSRTAGTAKRR